MYIFSGLKKRIGTRVGCTGFNLFCIFFHANRVKIQANIDFLKKEFLFPFAEYHRVEVAPVGSRPCGVLQNSRPLPEACQLEVLVHYVSCS